MEKNINTIAPIAISANGIEIYPRANGELHYHREDLHVEALAKITLPENSGFLRITIDMGHIIGVDHLVETTSDDTIVYLKRGNRNGLSRMVLNRKAEETRFVTAILCVNTDPEDPDFLPGTEGKWVLATLFEGDPGEKETFDRAFAKADSDPEVAKVLAKAWAFWAKHALVPTEKELQDIKKGYAVSLQMIEKLWEETNPASDPDKANNGGGYSQPHIVLEFSDGIIADILDTSCGEFGSRVSASFSIGSDSWCARWGSMDGEINCYSEIPAVLFSEHIACICLMYGYYIPTKEDIANWDADEAEWDDDPDWE